MSNQMDQLFRLAPQTLNKVLKSLCGKAMLYIQTIKFKEANLSSKIRKI